MKNKKKNKKITAESNVKKPKYKKVINILKGRRQILKG